MIRPFSIAALLILALPGTPAEAKGNAWFGTGVLKLKDAREPPETLVYSDAGGGAMKMVSVEQGSVIVTRFDGKPSPDIGTGAGKGNALAIKALSPTRYSWTFFRAGKPVVRGRNTLAADRRSFTELSWPLPDPRKLVSLVYVRR